MDQHGALKRNDDHWTLAEERRGAQDPTQVGVAPQALAIEAIYALSPQAKAASSASGAPCRSARLGTAARGCVHGG